MPSTSLATPVRASLALAAMSTSKKLLLLLGNAIALFQVLAVALLIGFMWQSPWLCVAAVLAFVYLLPPALCRLVMFVYPIRRQVIPLGSRYFFVWWFTVNFQMVFSRFPFLEEVLRMVPSCYSCWLRLWGAKIGRLTYWAAGVRILDRHFLEIGDDVTFGAGVRLNPHVIVPDAAGHMVLVLAPVKIGDRVSIGGYSLLVAGTEITADQCTRSFLILPPLSRLEDGRRIKPADGALSLE